jgi:hypothetical protein
MKLKQSQNPQHLNPYVFQSDFLEFCHRAGPKNYTLTRTIVIELGTKPNGSCSGTGWTLSEMGELTLLKGFRSNGPNVVPDSACRMLAAFVHDALCSKQAKGAYGYWRKNKIYADIMRAQGGGAMSYVDFAGLLLGNWAS